MTRTEFIEGYARRSGDLDATTAILGFVSMGDFRLIAMPCGCGEEGCDGWVMLGPEHISHHLAFSAPEPLRSAYRDAIGSDNIA